MGKGGAREARPGAERDETGERRACSPLVGTGRNVARGRGARREVEFTSGVALATGGGRGLERPQACARPHWRNGQG